MNLDNIYWIYLILVPTILVVYFIFNKKNKYGFSQIEFWKFWKQKSLGQMMEVHKFKRCSIFGNTFLVIAILLWFSLIPELLVMGFDSSVTLHTNSQDSTDIICDSRFYYKIENATVGCSNYSLHLSFYGVYNIITMVGFIIFANLFYYFHGYFFKIKKWSKQSFYPIYSANYHEESDKKKILVYRILFLITHLCINVSTHLAAVLPFTASQMNWASYLQQFKNHAELKDGILTWSMHWMEIPSLVFNFISIASVSSFLLCFFKLHSLTYLRYQKAIIDTYESI